MKTVMGLVGGLLGIAFCLAIVQLVNSLAIGPSFPAYGGDSDFSLRAAWFFVLLLPGFLVLGAWVGLLFARARKEGLCALAGVLIATLAYFGLLVALANAIESLPDESSANISVVVAFVTWLTLVAIGIYVGAKAARHHTGG